MSKFLYLLIMFISSPALCKIRIAIIDDFSGHGKIIYSLIHKNTDAEITKFDLTSKNPEQYYEFLKKIKNESFDILNLSLGHIDFDQQEYFLLKEISLNGTAIVTAAGNDNQRLGQRNKIFPCMLKISNLYCVGAGDSSKAKDSNFGVGVSYFVSGKFNNEDATSYAAPRFSALLSRVLTISNINLETFLNTRSNFVIVNNETIQILNIQELKFDIDFLLLNQNRNYIAKYGF
jgi:hypothetical protein